MYDSDVMVLVSVLDTSNFRCDIGILSSLVLCHHHIAHSIILHFYLHSCLIKIWEQNKIYGE